MSTNGDRIYRPVEPSDLPRIQAGILKAFYQSTLVPAKYMSARYGATKDVAFLVEGKDWDFLAGIKQVVVDVTPEKRYAIWDHRLQKFLNTDDGYGFKNKQDAEIAAGNYLNKKTYIVEWEIKDE